MPIKGGFDATFNRCDVYNARDNATGISGHGSDLASCLEVEAKRSFNIQSMYYSLPDR